jgi:hypothetical protein
MEAKGCCTLAQEYDLLASNRLSIMELQGRIPKFELFKMNTGMPGPFCMDWDGCLGHPLLQYDSHRLYSMLHQRHPLSPVLNARWNSMDSKVLK